MSLEDVADNSMKDKSERLALKVIEIKDARIKYLERENQMLLDLIKELNEPKAQ